MSFFKGQSPSSKTLEIVSKYYQMRNEVNNLHHLNTNNHVHLLNGWLDNLEVLVLVFLDKTFHKTDNVKYGQTKVVDQSDDPDAPPLPTRTEIVETLEQ